MHKDAKLLVDSVSYISRQISKILLLELLYALLYALLLSVFKLSHRAGSRFITVEITVQITVGMYIYAKKCIIIHNTSWACLRQKDSFNEHVN